MASTEMGRDKQLLAQVLDGYLHYPIRFAYDSLANIGMIENYNICAHHALDWTDVVDALGARLQVVLTRQSLFFVERSPDLHTAPTIVLYDA